MQIQSYIAYITQDQLFSFSHLAANMQNRKGDSDIKVLHKKFKFLDKPDIKLIYEFCDLNVEKTEKILVMAMQIPNPKSIIRILIEQPEKAANLLLGLTRRYDQVHFNKQKSEISSIMRSNENCLSFFHHMPSDLCLSIIQYLNPYEFFKFGLTCKKLYSITNSEGSSQYFRILCMNLFEKISPKMPEQVRFLQVRQYVLDHAQQFGPNTRGVVMNRLRYYVWQLHPKVQKKQTSYYHQFDSYRSIFFQCARVHFNGYYMCKHQYRKEQTNRDIIRMNFPVHLVSYYRYLRFFEDGSVISAVLPHKANETQITEALSVQHLDKDVQELEGIKEVMIGQYYTQGSKVHVKIAKSCSIFNYELEIGNHNNDKSSCFNRLAVFKYWLRVVDEKQIIQVLNEQNQQRCLQFIYHHDTALAKQNSRVVRGSSL